MITPEQYAASLAISDLRLSNDAAWAVYTVGPSLREGKHTKSALWVAETSIAGSAKQVTPGTYRDYSPVFHPRKHEIFFLSDRHNVGSDGQIYRLSLGPVGGEAVPITPLTNNKGIRAFSISPNGKYLAFISPDEPSPDASESVADIWGEKRDLGRLHIIDLDDTNLRIRTLVSTEANVSTIIWNPDSTQILYRLLRSTDADSVCLPTIERIVSVSPGADEISFSYEYTYAPKNSIWTKEGDLFFITGTSPHSLLTSYVLWERSITANSSPTLIPLSGTEADDIKDLCSRSRRAYLVKSGLDTRIEVVDSYGKQFTAFETDNESIWSTDVKLTNSGYYVYATIRSSGVSGEPDEIWVGSTIDGEKGKLSFKLSSHNNWCQKIALPIARPFQWTSSDGQALEGVISYPAGSESKRLPTVVVAHGGPYGRDTLGLYFAIHAWREFIASHGYLVLSPNYRGSSGRGEDFAAAANGGMGKLDWEDIDTMITAAVDCGLADPERLAIAGYSQGGFLAAWGCTRPGNCFKAGVVGGAPTDWNSLVVTSDLPDVEASLSGGTPWSASIDSRGSPLQDVENLTAPLLIIHGVEDKRVPLSQAVALMRGIERRVPEVAKQCQLVMYPREGHIFEERAHCEDMLWGWATRL